MARNTELEEDMIIEKIKKETRLYKHGTTSLENPKQREPDQQPSACRESWHCILKALNTTQQSTSAVAVSRFLGVCVLGGMCGGRFFFFFGRERGK